MEKIYDATLGSRRQLDAQLLDLLQTKLDWFSLGLLP